VKEGRYPTKAEITRVVEAARALKIEVTSLEVGPGFVRILPNRPANDGGNAFDDWKKNRQGG
jgi:hypothetical protein